MLITSVCAISLFAQAVSLVVTAFINYDAIGIIVFLLVVEIIPSIFLLNLYRIASDFTKSKSKTKKTSRRGNEGGDSQSIKLKVKVANIETDAGTSRMSEEHEVEVSAKDMELELVKNDRD